MKQAKPKDKSETYFASSNALDQLVKGKDDGGIDQVEFNGMKFVRKGASKKDFMISKQTVVLGDYITEIKNGQEVIKTDKHGTKIREMPSLTDDLKTQIKLYLYNPKTKQYTLNEKAWRALAGDSVIRKVPK